MKALFLSLAVFLFCHSVLAFSFSNLRDDAYVPSHCRVTKIDDFNVSQLEVFTVSVEGSDQTGFTFQYPISRSDAGMLFRAFNDGSAWRPEFQEQISQYPELYRDFKVLMDEHQYRGFAFKSEGEVLELLSINLIQMNLNQMGILAFVSGSVRYHGPSRNANNGELDVIIADFQTCKVFAYGEVKLGAHRIGKAREQVMRFSNNLMAYGINHQLKNPSIRYIY